MDDCSGVRVDHSQAYGACLLAARDFSAGEIVLAEKPSFLLNACSPSPSAGLLAAVNNATKNAGSALTSQLAGILALWSSLPAKSRADMADGFFSTPDQSDMTAFLEGLIRDIQTRWMPLQESEISSLIRAVQAWLLSAHVTDDDGAGLYRIGCRANSSCDPNIAFHSEPGTNRLIYRALRPIAADEELCFSYLVATELLMPTHLRQQRLRAAKYFECGCERCRRVEDPDRALPCSKTGGCDGQATPHRPRGTDGGESKPAGEADGTKAYWCCSKCGSNEPPSASTLEREDALTRASLVGCGIDEAFVSLDGDVSWHRHWVWGELLWGSGVAKLRGGVEGGNDADVWAGVALCKRYFAAVRSRGHPLHFVSSRAAEAYACLEALALAASNGGHLDKAGAAAAAAVQLCAAYVPALEHEYGDADAHNVRMRAFCRGHCGRCGSAASSRCSRCKLVGYCSAACQKAAWKEHKDSCVQL